MVVRVADISNSNFRPLIEKFGVRVILVSVDNPGPDFKNPGFWAISDIPRLSPRNLNLIVDYSL